MDISTSKRWEGFKIRLEGEFGMEKYRCYPSVVCVGKKTEVTIFPSDISRRFRDDKEYEMSVIGLEEDELDFISSIPCSHPCEVKNGCLHFSYVFETEQEYGIRFREKGTKQLTKLYMYAVEEDLWSLRPLKGDLHTHSYYSDGEDGIPMTPANYREQGFDFFSLTDHNRMFTSELAAELYEDIPLGMNIIRGEEIHTPDSQLHIIHVGGQSSVCDRYIRYEAEFEAEVADIERTLTHIPKQYRYRVASAKWACNEIHKCGGIAIFAHPYWKPRRYNITKEFADYLFEENIFDALELIGGISISSNNLQLSLWQEQLIKGNNIPVVGSSDSHDHNSSNGKYGRRFTYVFARSNKTEDILEAIRRGMCVAGEVSPSDENEVRFYSSKMRLVLFSHFLYKYYFTEVRRLSAVEGVLMRRYAQGESVGQVLATLSDTNEEFYNKYYGITTSPTIGSERENYLNKCLELQRTIGPVTKSASLNICKKENNERRE